MQSAVTKCGECGQANRVRLDRLVLGPKCGKCATGLLGAPVFVDDDALDWLIANSDVPVLVDFYADWCGPCRQLSPILGELNQELSGKLVVAKVDTQRHQRHATQLGVQGIPALFLYNGGEKVEEAVGLQPLPSLRRLVRPYVG